MPNPLIEGATCAWRGLKLIRQPGLRRFVVIPLAINTVLFAGVIAYAASRLDGLIERLLPGWLDWLGWLLWPLFAVGIGLVVFYTFSLVANLIGAPFNGWLAEAVERRLRRQADTPGGAWWKTLAQVPTAVASELRKLGYFLAWSVPFLILFLVPVVNLAAPFLWMGFSAWMLALEYADYPLGNHGLHFPEQRRMLARQRLLTLGFGAAVMLLTLIPVVNFLAMPAAVAGATVLWLEHFADGESGNRDEKRESKR